MNIIFEFKNKYKKELTIFSLILLTIFYISFYNNVTKESSNSEKQPFQINNFTTENPNLVEVTKIVDGDTIKILFMDKEETVRFIAVDTPELNSSTKPVQCYAQQSKDFLTEKIGNGKVILEKEPLDNDRDVYGRLLRYVFTENNENINDLLVKNGYAFEKTYVDGYKYQTQFKESQKYAMENKLGLWAENTCNGNPYNKPINTNPEIPPPIYNQEVKGITSYICDCSKKCSQIKTCEEAYYQLTQCGCTQRDDNADGIPCESVCR